MRNSKQLFTATVSMSKARYSSDDGGDESQVDRSDVADDAPVARRAGNLGKRNNSMGLNYYECANEKLYEAYAELHLLAQGMNRTQLA